MLLMNPLPTPCKKLPFFCLSFCRARIFSVREYHDFVFQVCTIDYVPCYGLCTFITFNTCLKRFVKWKQGQVKVEILDNGDFEVSRIVPALPLLPTRKLPSLANIKRYLEHGYPIYFLTPSQHLEQHFSTLNYGYSVSINGEPPVVVFGHFGNTLFERMGFVRGKTLQSLT